jgi:hypothetical protein
MDSKLLNEIYDNECYQREIFVRSDKNPFNCIDDLLEILIIALKEQKPYSMIRLGDGEGRILGYPSVFETEIYLNQVLTYQFGRGVLKELELVFGSGYLDHSMVELKSFITNAISNADIIGAPSWLHFRADITEKNIIPLAAQSVCLEYAEMQFSRGAKIFDHFIFKPFHQAGFFNKLLKNVDKLNIISHTDISDRIEKYFDLKECKHIKIPGHQSFMKTNELHYPVVYKDVIKKINVVHQGDLFFVAAGYLGKYYCNYIKNNGGIAIDIGSIFDGWSGIGRADSIKKEEQRI